MYNKLLQCATSLENHPILSSIKKGFILIIPILITGSLALLICNFPIVQLREFLTVFAGGFFNRLLLGIFDCTSGFMSGFLVLSISYYYSCTFNPQSPTLRIMAMFTSFVCFLASFGGVTGSLTIECFGTTGVFTAIFSAIITTRLFFFFYLRLNRGLHHYSAGADINYIDSITAIVPLILSASLFILANGLLVLLFQVNNFNDLIARGFVAFFDQTKSEFGSGFLFTLLLNFLWAFGIHGGNALDQVAQAVFVPANLDPNLIISKSFLDNFAQIGGSGATICLLLALLLASKSRSNHRLERSIFPLALFNINEILVFGLPIVLNPAMMLPFVLVPLSSLAIAYGATVIGLVPIVNQTIGWTTPVFFSGYLATGSIMGIVLQIVIVAVGTVIYIPFIRFSEDVQRSREAFLLTKLTAHFRAAEKSDRVPLYLNRNDDIGIIAKTVAERLHAALREPDIRMFYQPQVDAAEYVIGAEALLRWQFAGTVVYPPLVIALSREDGCYDKLTEKILITACRDSSFLQREISPALKISVNISAEQLNDKDFVANVIALVEQYGVQGCIALEVTEESALSQFLNITQNIELLRQNGIFMAIDDFSMGKTSLNYLQNNGFQYVKLDGELVRQATQNPRCREIIASIVSLGKGLGFLVTAEYVENVEIHDILLNLGCQCFQGYYYSPAVSCEELAAYCKDMTLGLKG